MKRPVCVEAETQDYFCSSDWFSQFVAECLVPVDQNTKAKDVYIIYQQWAKENAIRLVHLADSRFSRKMKVCFRRDKHLSPIAAAFG